MCTTIVDIIIPVYNEGSNIIAVLESIRKNLCYSYKVIICYDYEDDNTLYALQDYRLSSVVLVKNTGIGALGAVLSGISKSESKCVITFPADDNYNAERLNILIKKFIEGNDIVVASRFMKGGCMHGCPLIKKMLVYSSSWFMKHVARVPVHDSSNGLRLFSKKILKTIPIESKKGFAFSIELLVKAHRLGLPIAEVPFHWYERVSGKSKFRTLSWLPQYLKWVIYALQTTYCINLKNKN